MSNFNWDLFWNVVFGVVIAGLVIVALAAVVSSSQDEGESEGFRRGWIAGIDYEKHRRESEDEKA